MQQYMDERAEVEVVMKAPPPARCKFVSIDARASKDFADHVLALEFDEMRFALLYGASAEGGGGRVDAFYEPYDDWPEEGGAAPEASEPKGVDDYNGFNGASE